MLAWSDYLFVVGLVLLGLAVDVFLIKVSGPRGPP
jgi:hypothetical protein